MFLFDLLKFLDSKWNGGKKGDKAGSESVWVPFKERILHITRINVELLNSNVGWERHEKEIGCNGRILRKNKGIIV